MEIVIGYLKKRLFICRFFGIEEIFLILVV